MDKEDIIRLKTAAARTCCGEEEDSNEWFNPDDYAAGNIDDAYYNGIDDGETQMARTVLEMLGIDWKSS